MDAIALLAPQTASVEASTENVSQKTPADGKEFAAVLNENMKDSQPTQETEPQTEKKAEDSTSETQADAGALAVVAQLMPGVTQVQVESTVAATTDAVTAIDQANQGDQTIPVDVQPNTASVDVPVKQAGAADFAVPAANTGAQVAPDAQTAQINEPVPVTQAGQAGAQDGVQAKVQSESAITQDAKTTNQSVEYANAATFARVAAKVESTSTANTAAAAVVDDGVDLNAQTTSQPTTQVETNAGQTDQNASAQAKATKSGSKTIEDQMVQTADDSAQSSQTVKQANVNANSGDQVIAAAATQTETLEVPVTDTTAPANPDGTDVTVIANTAPKAAEPATQAEAAAKVETPRTADDLHTQIIDQVVREVSLKKTSDRSDLVVKLTPPELGTLRVHITQTAEGMVSNIQASSDQVRNMLQAHAPALVEALSNAGIKMDSVSVTSGLSFGSMMQDNAYSSAQQQMGSNSRRYHTHAQGMADTGVMINAAATSSDAGSGAGYSWLA